MRKKAVYQARRLLQILLLILPAAVPGGCGLIGGFYGVFIDPIIPKAPIPAEHEMSGEKILLWVDYEPQKEPHHLLRRELTRQLQQELVRNEAVGAVIDYQQIIQYRLAHPESADMTIQQLGRHFAADQVLYLLIDDFELQHEAGPGFYKPRITGYGKVIDVASGKRLWPLDETQRPFTMDLGFIEANDSSQELPLVRELCRQAAQKIARFFYKHKPIREGT